MYVDYVCDDPMTMEEENKTKYSNGLNENYNDTSCLDDHER